jgi:hypothetical protein
VWSVGRWEAAAAVPSGLCQCDPCAALRAWTGLCGEVRISRITFAARKGWSCLRAGCSLVDAVVAGALLF